MSGDHRHRDEESDELPPSHERGGSGERGALGGDLDRYARDGAHGSAKDDARGALGQDHADLWQARPHRDDDDRTLPPIEDSTSAFADKVLNPKKVEPLESAGPTLPPAPPASPVLPLAPLPPLPVQAAPLTVSAPAAAALPAAPALSAPAPAKPAPPKPAPLVSPTTPSAAPASVQTPPASLPRARAVAATSATSSAPVAAANSSAGDRLLRSLGRSAPRAAAAAAAASVAAAPTSLGRTTDAVRALRGGPTQPRKSLAVSHGLLMAVALVMSLLVHTTVGVMIARMPVGQFDASLIEKPERQFKVAPFKDDPIYRDPVLISDEPLPQPSKDPALADIGKLLLRSGGGGDPAALTAAALSQHIIKSSAAPGAPGTTSQGTGTGTGNAAGSEGSAVIASRVKHDDKQPQDAREAIAPTVTNSVEALPADVATRLAGGAKVELPLNTGTSTPVASVEPRPAAEGPTSSNTARSLLKGSIGNAAFSGASGVPGIGAPGGTGTGGSGGHIVGGRIAVADATPAIDRRLLDAPPPPPSPIDIAALPIQDAVKLDVPEKLDDDFDIAVSRFRPEIGGGLFQSAKPDRYSYFRIDLSARRSLRKLKTIPKDVVFLIDTSGSVPQEWVNNMVSGVKDALSSLNEGDRFNIVFFAEKPSFFDAEKIQPVTTLTLAAAQQFLTQAKSAGDTDINRALGRLLARDLLTERAYYLIFISDGVPTRGVMDNRELINTITRDNDLAAGIYCVGVGYQQNRQLLDYLAYRNKGYSLYAKEPGDAATQIRELASRIRYPIIKGLSTNVIGLDAGEVFPHNLPNIHQGEKLSIYGRYETPSQFTMRVSGHNGGKGLDLTFTGNLATAPAGEKEIPDQWGFWKLHHLYSEIIRKGETPAIKEQIRELKERFDLKTLY